MAVIEDIKQALHEMPESDLIAYIDELRSKRQAASVLQPKKTVARAKRSKSKTVAGLVSSMSEADRAALAKMLEEDLNA